MSLETEELRELKASLKEITDRFAEAVKADASFKPSEKDIKAAKAISKAILAAEKSLYHEGEFDADFGQLYLVEPFLGGISIGVSKIADFGMPTAYVGVRKKDKAHEVIMGFNPSFFRDLTARERRGVIKHELYHLVFQHIFARAIGDKSLAMLWNWATDLAINSIIGIDNLPDFCLCPGHNSTDPSTGKPVDSVYAEFIKNAKPLQSSDYYFDELRKLMEEQGDTEDSLEASAGLGTLDDHSSWEEMPEEVRDEIRNKIQEMVEKGVANSDKNNMWGSVPSEIRSHIRKMLSREVDWRSIMHNFFGRVRSMERTSSMKRMNKKMPYIQPGVKRKYKAKFSCFIDQSGSMSDTDIAQLFSELENLAKETEIDVYHFDTEIDLESKTTWRKGMNFPTPHRTRCGGTNFNCIANYCNDAKTPQYDGVVILTDGYADQMAGITRSKVLWVITEGGTMNTVRQGDLAVKMKADQGKFKTY